MLKCSPSQLYFVSFGLLNHFVIVCVCVLLITCLKFLSITGKLDAKDCLSYTWIAKSFCDMCNCVWLTTCLKFLTFTGKSDAKDSLHAGRWFTAKEVHVDNMLMD